MSQPFADHDSLFEYRLNQLKEQRENLFKKLDSEYFKELESNGNFNSDRCKLIASIKNKLRDFPDEMKNKNFSSREEIINYTPTSFYEVF